MFPSFQIFGLGLSLFCSLRHLFLIPLRLVHSTFILVLRDLFLEMIILVLITINQHSSYSSQPISFEDP